MSQPAKTETYYAMALDPIHVGTGGYRLGRVDNSIVREPGTNIPKVPGTSLSGACRAYASMVTGRYKRKKNGRIFSCAGQGQEDKQRNKAGHCAEHDCPVCVAFGFARDRTGLQGLAQFTDMRILFFPVYSLVGPVWVTCPAVLKDAGLSCKCEPSGNKIKVSEGLKINGNRLSLGWLMLEVEGKFEIQSILPVLPVPGEIVQHSVIVPNRLFTTIVNSNLEIRTSVSIDPRTGAAEEGALFTYEAIPRSTIFWFNISYLDPKFFTIDGITPEPKINNKPTTVQEVVEKGLAQFQHLGIGGMNTRGMGRLVIYGLQTQSQKGTSPEEKSKEHEVENPPLEEAKS